jgi:hypothetical protein
MAKAGGTNGKSGRIRVGIGGWTYEPWRGEFYPKGLPHARELTYASERLTTIEINGTFYRTQSPATFAKWAKETPEDLCFRERCATRQPQSPKRRGVSRRNGKSGLLGWARLGPICGGSAASSDDFGAFLALLPRSLGAGCATSWRCGMPHSACRVRRLLRKLRCRRVCRHATSSNSDPIGDFVYRGCKGQDSIATCYPPRSWMPGPSGPKRAKGDARRRWSATSKTQSARATCSPSSTRQRCGRGRAMEMVSGQ